MHDLKKKALGGIKGMLEGRMVDRMRPKPEGKDREVAEVGSEFVDDENQDPAPMEGKPSDASGVQPDGPFEAAVVQMGGDLAKLTPEEMELLKDILEKAGVN